MDEHIQKEGARNPRFILKAFGMILIFAIVIIALLRDRIVQNPQWQVSVTGRGTVEYQPDEATVSMGVQVERVYSAENALKQLNEKVNKVLAAVAEVGIPGDAVTTQTFTLTPQYDYVNERQVLAGYTAVQQIDVKVVDIEKESATISSLIDAATKAGVNQINGITFDVKDADELKQEARLLAIADARSKAGSLSQAAQVRLGKVVGWWENYIMEPGQNFYMDGKGGGGAGSPSLPTGKQEIVVEVNLSYLVK